MDLTPASTGAFPFPSFQPSPSPLQPPYRWLVSNCLDSYLTVSQVSDLDHGYFALSLTGLPPKRTEAARRFVADRDRHSPRDETLETAPMDPVSAHEVRARSVTLAGGTLDSTH